MIDLLESLVSTEFIRAFALTLFHSLWQGALFALVTAGIILILRKYRPALRYAVLYTLLLLFPVFFVVTFIIVHNPEKEEPGYNSLYASNTVHAEIIPGVDGLNDSGSDPIRAIYLKVAGFFENNARSFVMFWLVGFLFILIRFSGSVLYVYRLKNHRVYCVDDRWETHLRRLSDRLGLKRTVKLAESGLARIPMTIGYLKPVILLPIGTLSGVPPQQLDAILLHELAHILRKDYLLNIMQSVIELLFFYHPFTWWLSGLLRQEREHICDDLAIDVNKDHINYIKALTTMEELNSRSPLLASAMTGSKKKLLMRVKRLINPVKLRKGFGQGTVAFLFLISLVFALSLNALSFIPNSFDLTGRESGERIYNFLPYNPEVPDTIKAVSKSGKVFIEVYTDTVDSDDENNVQVFVEKLDDQLNDAEDVKKEYRKEVIIKKKGSGDLGSTGKIIIIKSGDSLSVFNNDTVLVLPDGYDTTFTADGGIGFYEFETHEIPEFPDFINGPEIQYYIFNEDQKAAQVEFERALRDEKFDMNEFEKQHRELEKEMSKNMIIIENPEDMPHEWNWVQRPPENEPGIRQSERIIRQELRDDGLTERGRKYVIEIDSKAMYINGEKQPKEIYRKYSRLVESLDGIQPEGDQSFKIIF